MVLCFRQNPALFGLFEGVDITCIDLNQATPLKLAFYDVREVWRDERDARTGANAHASLGVSAFGTGIVQIYVVEEVHHSEATSNNAYKYTTVQQESNMLGEGRCGLRNTQSKSSRAISTSATSCMSSPMIASRDTVESVTVVNEGRSLSSTLMFSAPASGKSTAA